MGIFDRTIPVRMRNILLVVVFLVAQIGASQPSALMRYDQGRLLDELNVPNRGDGYPWLSADGLRLYYTKEVEPTVNRIFVSHRATVNDQFAPGTSITMFVDAVGGWLSQDELVMWFTTGDLLVRSTRADAIANFVGATYLTRVGGTQYAIVSPTLTPDGAQLFIASIGGVEYYERTGPNEYTFMGDFASEFGPYISCKLDTTGLVLYIQGDIGSGYSRPIRMTRATLQDSFGDPHYFAGDVFSGNYHWIHSFFSQDETTLLMARATFFWSGNELYMAKGFNTTSIEENWVPVPVIWPNPTSHAIHVQPPASIGKTPYVRIFDMQGRCVSETPFAQYASTIDVSMMPAGHYRAQIIGELGQGNYGFMVE